MNQQSKAKLALNSQAVKDPINSSSKGGTRRQFVKRSFAMASLASLSSITAIPLVGCSKSSSPDNLSDSGVQTKNDTENQTWFDISLAQWSLHRQFLSGKSSTREFAALAKNEFGINAIEYVNQFYMDDYSQALINDLKQRSADLGVKNVLIMVDKEGHLGASDKSERLKAIDQHKRWADMAHQLGCHSLRVNAYGDGDYQAQISQAAEGLNGLSDYCQPLGLSVCVENHGDLSSNGEWLASVMQTAANPNVGTLPDFGNFVTNYDTKEEFDKYRGVELLMPYAKGVSAKVFNFDDEGMEPDIDFIRMFKMVKDANYSGYVGIEYEGENNGLTEFEGIHKTHELIKRMRAYYA